MSVCPLEFRYGREEMKRLFSDVGKLQAMLDVEAALAFALAELGIIPKRAAKIIASKANGRYISPERVAEIEKEINHDVMAVVRALAEQCGSAGGYVHLGATSNDIIDTATAVQLSAAIDILLRDLETLRDVLAGLALRHKRTVMIGRTHGQFALPITFGLKMAVFTMEVQRHIERLQQARERVCVGKMSGAVGTAAALGKDALRVQEIVMKRLGVSAEDAATQLVGRDRYAEFVLVMANLAASLEKFATEVRLLQRSEVCEVSEAFDPERQVGSSTMAQKRNPVLAENICGLARTLRGFAIPALESVVLWHERDLTNSSAERFVLPHVCILADDLLTKSARLFKHIVVNEERMLENLRSAGETAMAEAVMMSLARRGMGRQEAHELVRRCAMRSYDGEISFRDALLDEARIKKLMIPKEIDAALDPYNYLGSAEEIVEKLLGGSRRKR
ncbi:MAG: adenylosuccinate lyase [Candidatus Thermoplasmatota archaeon]